MAPCVATCPYNFAPSSTQKHYIIMCYFNTCMPCHGKGQKGRTNSERDREGKREGGREGKRGEKERERGQLVPLTSTVSSTVSAASNLTAVDVEVDDIEASHSGCEGDAKRLEAVKGIIRFLDKRDLLLGVKVTDRTIKLVKCLQHVVLTMSVLKLEE